MIKWFSVPILMLSLSSLASAKARVDAPLKIAIIQSKSDELKTLNKEFKEGVIIAMEQAAKAIPKLAKLIKVQEINSGKNFKQLQEATKRAITNYRSHVIIGNFFHNDNRYMAKEAAKWNKLFVAPVYRLEDIKNINPYAFSASKSYLQIGEDSAIFLYSKINQRQAVIVSETANPAQELMAKGFKRKFEALGGRVVSHISYDWDETSFENTYEQLRLTGAKYGFMPTYSRQSWDMMNNLKAEGIKTNFVGTQLWDSPDFLKALANNELKGQYYYSVFSKTSPFKKVQAFRRVFKDRYNTEANFLNFMGYETMSMVLETYVAANDNRAKPLASAMQNRTFKKGLLGVYKMNKKHFPTVSSSFNVITRNGSSFMTRIRYE